jgi:hypothetical protein
LAKYYQRAVDKFKVFCRIGVGQSVKRAFNKNPGQREEVVRTFKDQILIGIPVDQA